MVLNLDGHDNMIEEITRRISAGFLCHVGDGFGSNRSAKIEAPFGVIRVLLKVRINDGWILPEMVQDILVGVLLGRRS